MQNSFQKSLRLSVAIAIVMGTLLSALSYDSITTNQQIIKEHKIHSLTSFISISENNFEDEDGLQEKGRSMPSFLVLFSNLHSTYRISQFRLLESADFEKRVFLLFRHLRI